MSEHVVVVRYTFDDEYRRWIAHRYGSCGTMATVRRVRQHLMESGLSMDMDLQSEYNDCQEGCTPAPTPEGDRR